MEHCSVYNLLQTQMRFTLRDNRNEYALQNAVDTDESNKTATPQTIHATTGVSDQQNRNTHL